MSKKNIIKYVIRFFTIQIVTVMFTIWYFDNHLIINSSDKFRLYEKIIEDWSQYYSFVPLSLITIDTVLVILITIFIILLYATNFYTYVNELTFTLNKNYLQEFINLYLLWTAYIFSSFYILRFESLSRASLLIFTFLIPALLFVFRNSEILLLILGRSPLNEKYISFNLEEVSVFKKLRILSFRKELMSFNFDIQKDWRQIIKSIDATNKESETNLIVIDMHENNSLPPDLEMFLFKLNKKVLLISRNSILFNSVFIHRKEKIDNQLVYYFNNDVQYGARYILKRIIDIMISSIMLFVLFPIFVCIAIFILKIDGRPFVIKQKRVGLHGKKFGMFKFRTMKNNSHNLRSELKKYDKKTGPLFKLEEDPRLLVGSTFLRKYSLDELPQLINVIMGDMSLVGPRPLFEEDTQLFTENYMRRLNVLPGMTGLLQINDRNTDDFDIWFKYDLEYIENWSLYLDLKILLRTLPSMFKSRSLGK